MLAVLAVGFRIASTRGGPDVFFQLSDSLFSVFSVGLPARLVAAAARGGVFFAFAAVVAASAPASASSSPSLGILSGYLLGCQISPALEDLVPFSLAEVAGQ